MNKNKKLPALAAWILKQQLIFNLREGYSGDIEEEFYFIQNSKGTIKAMLWIWGQVLLSLPLLVKSYLYWSYNMIFNYLKIAFRTIKRNKVFSIINILGFAIGLACSILLFLWIIDEVSTNRFHTNLDDIFIVATHSKYGTRILTDVGTPPALGPALKQEYPEVINSTRYTNGKPSVVLIYGDRKFREAVQPVDPAFLDIFSFPMIKGDPKTALSKPQSIVMTEEMAQKYFGDDDPVGKIINFDNRFDYQVTGVVKNIPRNSTLQFDFLVRIEDLEKIYDRPNYTRTWFNLSFQTFIQLQKGVSFEELNVKVKDRIIENNPDENVEVFITPFKDYYLYYLGFGGGRIVQVRIFSIIAILILLIACINFMNLTTAKSGNRAREIGLRKVVGANKSTIISQFYGESILITLLSLVLSILIVMMLLPAFNHLTNKEITSDFLQDPVFILGLLSLTILTGLISGSYPALYMSSFRPVTILRGVFKSGLKRGVFRKVLVVLQFVFSVGLIFATLIIYQQLHFLKSKDLGFEKDLLIQVPMNRAHNQNYESIKQKLLSDPNIIHVTATSHSPIGIYWNGSGWQWPGKDPNIDPLITYFSVDENFLETFTIPLISGRFLTKNDIFPATENVSGKVVINEELARIMGKENPVGLQLSQPSDQEYHTIAGVIKDIHFKPLWANVGPMIMFFYPPRFQYLFIRIQPKEIPQTIATIKNTYAEFFPNFPFEYSFFHERYDRIYRPIERFGTIIQYFSIMAIIISCLGMFGLAFFMAEQRTREIGIRKILGASTIGLILLIVKEFLKLVLYANLIALPIAYLYMKNWLNDFAYQTGIGWTIFLLSGFVALIISVLTVSYQSIKVALTNPVNSVRYE